jgi:hypothetical protein
MFAQSCPYIQAFYAASSVAGRVRASNVDLGPSRGLLVQRERRQNWQTRNSEAPAGNAG